MKRMIGSALAVGAMVAGSLFFGMSAAQAGGTGLTVSPDPSMVGQTITVTPAAACPDTATEARLIYSRPDTTVIDDKVIPLDGDFTFSDSVSFDHAGEYIVRGDCQHDTCPTLNAGHRAVRGCGIVPDATFNQQHIQVNGTVNAAPTSTTPGGTVTFTPATGSTCDAPVGVVTITVKDPDGVDVVTNATPTVGSDGTFSVPATLTKVGTYTVIGTCQRNEVQTAAGHLQPAPTVSDDFTYTGTATVTPAPTTTTTTTAPPTVAAEAVAATPRFTG